MTEVRIDTCKKNLPEDSGEVVFMCGALRSGTTLLGLMLNSHPDIYNPGERDFLFECAPDQQSGKGFEKYKAELKLNRIFGHSNLAINEALGHDDLIHDFVEQMRSPGKKLVINIHRHFERILEIFPDARFIHLIRDPRDVARSSIGMGWAGNVYYGVDHWIASETSFGLLKGLAAPGQIADVKNEDLILDPEAVLGEICRFLGLSFNTEMLNYSHTSTYAPPDPSLIEQWRKKLSPKEIGLIEGKVGSMLGEAGYAGSGHPIVEGGDSVNAISLALENRWKRLQFRLSRYGWGLTLWDFLARTSRIGPLKNHAKLRINEVNDRHVK